MVTHTDNVIDVCTIFRKRLNFHTIFISSAECRVDNDCPVNRACINENCLNPCLNSERPCGRGAECLVEFHQARCVCSAGLQGNPLVACINVECRTDNDCRQDQGCDFISQTCGPVCGPNTCTEDASCRGVNHQPDCTCNPGSRGNGFVACIRRKIEHAWRRNHFQPLCLCSNCTY